MGDFIIEHTELAFFILFMTISAILLAIDRW